MHEILKNVKDIGVDSSEKASKLGVPANQRYLTQ